MKLLLLLLLSCAVCALANLTPTDLVKKYNELKKENHQDFPRSAADEKEHFLEFKQASDFIETHNSIDSDEWTATYNKFTTMTGAEKETFTGLNVSDVVLERRNSKFLMRRSIDLAKRNPTSVDYTEKLPAIKNQGSCGSCWTFGAAAALEYQVNKDRTGSVKSLSEQQYLDCVYEGSRDGCNGGWPTACYSWTRDNGNMIASQADMPYTGSDGTCNTDVNSAISGFSVGGSTYLDTGDTAMEDAVADVSIGVISVAIGVVNSFYSFSSGVYSETGCSSINHAVDVVGYGEMNGVGYWRVRNSWGSWGDNGYINMKRGLNGANIDTCSISSYGHYPIVAGSDDGSDEEGGTDDEEEMVCEWDVNETYKLKGSLTGMDYTLTEAKTACLEMEGCVGVSCKNNKCMLNEKTKGKSKQKFTAYTYSC